MGFVWTDDPLVVQTTDVKALHWNEIQDGLDAVYAAIGCDFNPACGPDWSADPLVVAGTTITPPPITELRQRADFAETQCCTVDNALNQADEKATEDSSYQGTNRVGYDGTDEGTYNNDDDGSDLGADKNSEDSTDYGVVRGAYDGGDNANYDASDDSPYHSGDDGSHNPGYDVGEETGYDSTYFAGYQATNYGVVA